MVVIATGVPYKQMGICQKLWHMLFPFEITLETLGTALNDHVLITGVPGVGKTRLNDALFRASVSAGHAVLSIDTHYDSFKQALNYCIREAIPPERVVIVDTTRPEYGIPDFHILETPNGLELYTTTDGLVSVFRGLAQALFGERMADILRMMFLAMQQADVPFTDCVAFLTYPETRERILANVHDSAVTHFWEHMASIRDFKMVIKSSRNKLNSFVMNPFIRPLFDRTESTVHLYDAFNTGTIVLINLSQNYFKDAGSRSLLGSLFLFLAYQALILRENDRYRHPVTLICDEIHEYYVAEFVLPLLTGLRKYGAGLKMFTQSLGYFPTQDVDVFMSTCGSVASFAVGHRDATRLAHEMAIPRIDRFIKEQARDLYGPYGKASYWGTGEQVNHIVSELMEQGQRELIWRIRGKDDIRVFIARVADVEDYTVTPEEEDAYRRASAAHHARVCTDPDTPKEPTTPESDVPEDELDDDW